MTLEEQFGSRDFENDPDRGANNLLEFLKYSPNVRALINAVIPEVQEADDAMKDVYTTINLFDAVGSQLDDIFGNLLDLERETGQSDDDYRAALLAQASIIARSGEIVILKALYKNLIIASSVRLYEFKTAHFKIEATVDSIPSQTELDRIRTKLEEAKQGGNGMSLSAGIEIEFELGEFDSPQLNDPAGLSGSGFDGGILAEGF